MLKNLIGTIKTFIFDFLFDIYIKDEYNIKNNTPERESYSGRLKLINKEDNE